MDPAVWIGIVAVFVSGGAIGAAGTLLAQWCVRKVISHQPSPTDRLDARELSMLRSDVAEMAGQIRNLDARLDFQEQLLGGATPLGRPPSRLPPPDPQGAVGSPGPPEEAHDLP